MPILDHERSTKTILVVDDEAAIARLAQAALQPLGYRVRLAASGLEALKIVEPAPELIDLILLDLHMPGLSGQETLAKLLAIHPQARVVLCSGCSPEHVDSTARANVLGFLQKPYRFGTLIAMVRIALEWKQTDAPAPEAHVESCLACAGRLERNPPRGAAAYESPRVGALPS